MTSPCSCVFDSKVFLEYFKVIFSFPTVVLLLVSVGLSLFTKDIRKLFVRVNKLPALGIELDPHTAAASIQKELAAQDESQLALKKSVDKLPEGEQKKLIEQALDAAVEANKQRLIAASLREQLALASAPKNRAAPSSDEIKALAFTLEGKDIFGRAVYYKWIPSVTQADGSLRFPWTAPDIAVTWVLYQGDFDTLVEEHGVRLVIGAIREAFRKQYEGQIEPRPTTN